MSFLLQKWPSKASGIYVNELEIVHGIIITIMVH